MARSVAAITSIRRRRGRNSVLGVFFIVFKSAERINSRRKGFEDDLDVLIAAIDVGAESFADFFVDEAAPCALNAVGREGATVSAETAVVDGVIIASGDDGCALRGEEVDEADDAVDGAVAFCNAKGSAREEVVLHVDDDEGIVFGDGILLGLLIGRCCCRNDVGINFFHERKILVKESCGN